MTGCSGLDFLQPVVQHGRDGLTSRRLRQEQKVRVAAPPLLLLDALTWRRR
jgi:hypothetical protein